VVLTQEPASVPADAVFVMTGTDLPLDLLRTLGVRLASDPRRELARVPWLLAFAAFTWAFYCLKQHRELFPFTPGRLGFLHEATRVAAPFLPTFDGQVRVLDAGFWGTLLYSLAITGFGLAAMRRYPSPTQRRRYARLIVFQSVFLFGIPENDAPIVTATPSALYSLSVPWPLSIWSLAHEPAAWGWLLLGLFSAFVLVPLYVWRKNESFCSTLCGCGGLAETVGDLWRSRAPRGDLAQRAERGGVIVLLLAIPVTALIVNDLWGLLGNHIWLDQQVIVAGTSVELGPAGPAQDGNMRVAEATSDGTTLHLRVEKSQAGAWQPDGWIRSIAYGEATIYPEKIEEGHYVVPVAGLPASAVLQVKAASSALSGATEFAKHWYGLMVDFGLASIVGVALYPWLGNRVWCRFFCPLRAWMELLSKRFGRLAIAADDRCISCGECTRYCQMGIDVQGFAQQQLHFDNVATACIQCGICVEVCPMDVLTLVDKRALGLPDGGRAPIGPRWGV
jgi:Pyruvate/2-oxoacid:ferredoxin oxidoreductase delta subunit